MPPESPLSEELNSAEEDSPLTDQNVAVLYQIIKSAEQYPHVETLPFRAIFAAYETILPENGLDPDHDQIYLRFLFRLGDRREEGQSLYESFEALLEELGFQIEFVPEEDGTRETTRKPGAGEGEVGANMQFRDTRGPQRRSRRASFNSMYDAEDESTRAVGSRPRSRASMSRLDVSQYSVLDPRPSTRATTRRTEKTSANTSPAKPAAKQTRRGRLTAEEFATHSQHYQRRHKSVSIQDDNQKQDPAPTTNLQPDAPVRVASLIGDARQTASDIEGDSTEAYTIPRPIQKAYVVGQREQLYNPSRTQLLRDANTFHHYHIRSVARSIVDKWCYAALQARDQNVHLKRLAAAHDIEILLRQAFEHWRLRLHARKQAVETERYFRHQERRTARARSLMLLSKAFTHWVRCAHDERLRNSEARHHVLSTKYFQAWKDITLSYQRKIHHQGVRKFFGIWKQRYVRSLTNDIKADLVRQHSLCRVVYWQWFWAFCARRAPEWRAGRLRRKYLSQWVAAFRGNRRQDQQITIHSHNLAQKKVLSQWIEKARNILSNCRQAALFQDQKQEGHALYAWRKTCQYAPLARQVSNMVDWRVAGATFAIFVTRYRFERQAETVNGMRTMRNAWTQWNDRLRWQTVAHRIDDRYCLEALYKWVVAERFLLLQRLFEERFKKRFLYKLRKEHSMRQTQRARIYDLVEDAQKKSCVQYFLIQWHSQLKSSRQAERIAFEFIAPRITQDALQSWTQNLSHLERLSGWAKDADFYFTTRRYIKRWRNASIESKRQKRKTAYIQVRRKSKMSLAAGALQQWRSATTQLRSMQQESELVSQNRLLHVGTKLFDNWRDKFDVRRDLQHQADHHYERRLFERHLYTWMERLEDQSRLEVIAGLNAEMRVKNVAFSWFNKLRLKIIELKGQESNAENLSNWYEKRHSRNILRQWQEQTVQRLNHQRVDRPERQLSSRGTRVRPRVEREDREEPTRRAEEWTDFDIGDWIPALEAQSNTTPLPGYLSTPSKRAARAKAMVRVPMTPAGTPFEQRLRSQIGSTPRTARRGGFGRSTNGLRGRTFGAILEDAPRTPDARRDE